MTPEPRRKKSRAEIVLLVLFALSVLSFVYSLATMVRELRRAEAMRTQPVWATLDGPAFELHAGATGSWEPKWLPVEGAIGSPVLWLDVSVPDIETAMRVLVRFDPPDSAHPYDPKRTSVDGEWELGERLDYTCALVLDPLRLRRIDWRVVSVSEAWAGRLMQLHADGNGTSDHIEEAYHKTLANWVGGFVCGVPHLLLTVFVGYRLWQIRRRHPTAPA